MRLMCTLLLLGASLAVPSASGATVQLEVGAAPIQRDVPRIGLNLGGSSTWGAEQLRTNVLHNPGFEPTLDRSLLIAADLGRESLHDDSPWLQRPAGFWNGASFDVRTGDAAGQTGRVLDGTETTPPSDAGKGAATSQHAAPWTLVPWPNRLQSGDAVSLTRTVPAAVPALWWVASGTVQTSTATRPGSGGRQSVHLLALPQQPARLAHHLDMIGERAGHLLPVSGPWQLRFWARAAHAGTSLQVRFHRHGSTAFLARALPLGSDWHLYTLPFEGNELADGPGTAALELSFEIAQGEVWLDDAFLGPARSGAGGFRTEVVRVLQRLHPGYLRDWQGQLGDSVSNRLAAEEARQPSRYRPGDNEQLYFYSLPDFFDLCAAVGAQPWVVAPSLSGDAEWRALGQWLAVAARQHGFHHVLVEFGNENWNSVFRPAGFLDARTHAAAADRAFRLLRAGAGPDARLITVVNAQFVNPAQVRQMAQLSREADRISVAPYFLFGLDVNDAAGALHAAFAESPDLVRADVDGALAGGKRLSASEVNFHTTAGTATVDTRRQLLEAPSAGAALVRRLLQNLLAGVREQAVYTLAGFDSRIDHNGGLIPLWGVTRDLAPGRLRPTGVALALLNEVVGGDLYPLACHGPAEECAAITGVVLRTGTSSTWVLTSAAERPIRVEAALPCGHRSTVSVLAGIAPAPLARAVGPVPHPAIEVAPVVDHTPLPCNPAPSFDLPAQALAVLNQPALSPSPSLLPSRH